MIERQIRSPIVGQLVSQLATALPWEQPGGGSTLPVNTVAPALATSLYAGASPSITAGTWTGAPTLTYSLEINGVEVVAPTTELLVEAYVCVLADEELSAIVYEIPNGITALRVASNTVAVSLVTKLLALATAASATWLVLKLVRRSAIDLTLSGSNVVTTLDKSGNARTGTKIGAGNAVFSTTSFNGKPGITVDGSAYIETASFDGAATKAVAFCLALDTTASLYSLISHGSTQTESASIEFLPNVSAGVIDVRMRGNVGLASARTNAQALGSAKCIIGSFDLGLMTNETIAYVNGVDDTASRPNNVNNTNDFSAASHPFTLFARDGGTQVAPSGTAIAAAGLLTGSVDATLIANIDTVIRGAWGVT